MTASKIFIYLTRDEPGYECAVALAEDGVMITGHISSSVYWSERDMGLDKTYPAEAKHSAYQRHFPNGYELVNLLHATEDELRSNPAFEAALTTHTLSNDKPS